MSVSVARESDVGSNRFPGCEERGRCGFFRVFNVTCAVVPGLLEMFV